MAGCSTGVWPILDLLFSCMDLSCLLIGIALDTTEGISSPPQSCHHFYTAVFAIGVAIGMFMGRARKDVSI